MCTLAQAETSPPDSWTKTPATSDKSKHQLLEPGILCFFMFISGCIFLGVWAHLCAYAYVRMYGRARMSVPSCLLAWLTTFCSEFIFSTLRLFFVCFYVFFFSSPLSYCFTLHSLYFRVFLDRRIASSKSCPISSQHPKAFELWEPECVCACVCVWVDTCAGWV